VVSLSGLPPQGQILEIGCGTGQTTEPFAHRGYRVLCIELGERLAAVARSKLAAHSQVVVRTGAFEVWPGEEGAFDLTVSAEAFHWINQTNAYRKIARRLRPEGALTLFWNRHVQGEGFFETAHEVNRREARELFKEHQLELPR